MTTDLAEFAAARDVKYFMISYTDLFGGQRAKLVPAQAIAEMQADGAGFAGFATWLDMTPAHPDLFAIPDAPSVIQLPWKPHYAWVAADCLMEGALVDQAPRVVLKKLVERATARGLPRQDRRGGGVLSDHARRIEDLRLLSMPPRSPAMTSRRSCAAPM